MSNTSNAICLMVTLSIYGCSSIELQEKQSRKAEWERMTASEVAQLPDDYAVFSEEGQTTLGEVRKRAEQDRPATAERIRRASDEAAREAREVFAGLEREFEERITVKSGNSDNRVFAEVAQAKIAAGILGPMNLVIPSVDLVWGLVTPGQQILVVGQGFGDEPGKVEIHVTPSLDLVLKDTDLVWADTYIVGRVPGVDKVQDQTAELVVERKAGAVSTGKNVDFLATKKIIWLPYGDATVVSCGTDSNWDECNGEAYDDQAFIIGCSGNMTLCGNHNNWWGTWGTDAGTDVYGIHLKNGWRLHHMKFWEYVSGAGEAAAAIGPFPTGSADWNPTITWWVTPNDSVGYDLDVWIEGPVGLSHK